MHYSTHLVLQLEMECIVSLRSHVVVLLTLYNNKHIHSTLVYVHVLFFDVVRFTLSVDPGMYLTCTLTHYNVH